LTLQESEKRFFFFVALNENRTFFFPEPGDELLGRQRSDLLLLRRDRVEEVGQARQQRLLAAFVVGTIL
jgi:hypothetical protein